jgi:hypothetical protein
MRIRRYRPSDHETLMKIQAANTDIIAYDPAAPLNIATVVAEDETGRVVGAVLVRTLVEGHLILDRAAPSSREEKWSQVRELIEDGLAECYSRGYEECAINVPPHMPGFAARLETLPFVKKDDRFKMRVPLLEMFTRTSA